MMDLEPGDMEKATIRTEDVPDTTLELWTDDQESALLRACVQWKPVGMHKHFRMIAIRSQLLSEGLINETDNHTSIAGIWKKLGTLYDLPGLDDREDTEVNDNAEDDTQNYWRDFELPRHDFEAMMWDRRLAPGGSSSPEMSRRESTVADTDEPRSSPIPGKSTSKGRAGARKSGRLSRLQNEIETESRRSKSASIADEDHPMEDAADGEGDDESGNGEEDSEEEDHDDDDKKGGAKKSARGPKKARGGSGRRGRRRG